MNCAQLCGEYFLNAVETIPQLQAVLAAANYALSWWLLNMIPQLAAANFALHWWLLATSCPGSC